MDDALRQQLQVELAASTRKAELELGITHVDGIPWHAAPQPRRWHRCRAQTTCTVWHVRRCACGAISMSLTENVWIDRNSRHRDT